VVECLVGWDGLHVEGLCCAGWLGCCNCGAASVGFVVECLVGWDGLHVEVLWCAGWLGCLVGWDGLHVEVLCCAGWLGGCNCGAAGVGFVVECLVGWDGLHVEVLCCAGWLGCCNRGVAQGPQVREVGPGGVVACSGNWVQA